MMSKYTIVSPAAILGGMAAACGAVALLVRDAWQTGFTVDHALMPVLVGITILTGHLLGSAVRSGRLISAAGLALLTILGSGLTIYETMGRRAEVRDTSVASADDTVKQRQRLAKKLTEAEEILGKHRADRDNECASGKGKKCDGLQYTAGTWEAAVTGYKAEITKLPPPKPVDPKAERLAAVLSILGVGAQEADIKKLVATLEPFALPLFLELGSIILFSFGIGRRRQDIAAIAPIEAVADNPATAPTLEPRQPRVDPKPPTPSGKRGRRADPKVIDFVRQFRERTGKAPSGGEVQANFPSMPTSTAYDYAKRA